jgi:hypothetical protein
VRVRGSDLGAMSKRPTSRKESNRIMSRDMELVHSSTCGRMYTRKASEDQRPRIMILAELWSIRKRAMAAPERIDRFPISWG